MANPNEIAELVVNGQRYSSWTSISVTQAFESEARVLSFTAASPVESGKGSWAGQKLKTGDKAQAYLAGVKVADGVVYIRQVGFDARGHQLQLQVLSKTIDLTYAAVDNKPGEFKNYDLAGIASALAKPFGIKFKIEGNPDGVKEKFERFAVQPGETVISAIHRLCKMRNLFLTDDADGNLVGMRVDGSGGVRAHLEEGRNIKSASCVMTDENAFSKIDVQGSTPGSDKRWGDEARDITASVTNPQFTRYRPQVVKAEEPGTQSAMKMRANWQAAINIASMLQASVVVQGWHDDKGQLWIKGVGQSVSVKSPMMFPSGQETLAIQSVTHRQTNAGTETEIGLVFEHRLSRTGQIQAGPPLAQGNPAKPEGKDVS